MGSVRCGTSVSACGPKCKAADGCLNMCGMCPSCAFAPRPPGSARCLWRASDKFKRSFVVELILRCRNIQMLRDIRAALDVASWTVFSYARSRSASSPQGPASRGTDVRPLGLDVKEIWEWFSSSPDWIKSRYLLALFTLCDSEMLRLIANLTGVLLARQKRGFLQFNVSGRSNIQHDQDSDEDSEDPALMIVPGSSQSVSGVSRYRDFICCLPVGLSKRILGLLDHHTLRCCQKVCRYWKSLSQETMDELKFRRVFQDQTKAVIMRYRGVNIISPTYSNFVEVPIPVHDDEKVDIHPGVQKVELFKAAYANVKTKKEKMEERNVYCGAYFTTVLLDKEDPHRAVDYGGGSLMAMGSKDCAVRLLYVASETKVVAVMKGHVGSVQAVLLCEDRDLVLTASCDASIRCWDLKTDRCVMMLYGHTGTVNCLDVHADRLVSGAKDCLVKGKHFEEFHFKHPSSVRCVRINTTAVYSSCDRGLVKVWDLEHGSLLRVVDAHRSSVKCLFLDKWHFLSGDSNGQVMAWSISCDVKQCLMTFKHPKEVKALTLMYLRVITGCLDGKIRIFNFLTGDCLRDIMAEGETGRILSLHFHDNGILVNTKSGVKRFQFAKVFWDCAAEGGRSDVAEKSAASLRKLPFTSVGTDHAAKVVPRRQKTHGRSIKKPESGELLNRARSLAAPAKCRARARGRCAEPSVMLSEKATSERMKRRGLHHPPTQDSILLRVSAIQGAQCTDEVSINMERNARLRDYWGPQGLPQSTRVKTCVPILKRAVSQNTTSRMRNKTAPRSADARRTVERASGVTTRASEGPQAAERGLMRSLTNLESTLSRISPVGPSREQTGFRLLTVTQQENRVQAGRDLEKSSEQ